MPTWSHEPPLNPRGPSFEIVRTPPGQLLRAIVTSEDLIGCYTHFWKRRTMPCERIECEACHAGIPFRWHAYMSVYLSKTYAHVIFECTAQASSSFVEYREAHGTLRGCLFTATRRNYAPNARVIIQCRPANLTEIAIPKAPDLVACLAILWDLPFPDL